MFVTNWFTFAFLLVQLFTGRAISQRTVTTACLFVQVISFRAACLLAYRFTLAGRLVKLLSIWAGSSTIATAMLFVESVPISASFSTFRGLADTFCWIQGLPVFAGKGAVGAGYRVLSNGSHIKGYEKKTYLGYHMHLPREMRRQQQTQRGGLRRK